MYTIGYILCAIAKVIGSQSLYFFARHTFRSGSLKDQLYYRKKLRQWNKRNQLY